MKLSLSIFLTLLISVVFGQENIKIGYTNAEYIAYSHPDYQVILRQLEEHKGKIQQMMQQKYKEYETLGREFQQLQQQPGVDELILRDKQQQAMNKEAEIQQFQATAEQGMMEKQQQLMVPLQKKIQVAIEAVAKEKGYTHVFDGNSLLYMVNAESSNITDDVLKKLGISATAGASSNPLSPGSSTSNPGGNRPSMLEVR